MGVKTFKVRLKTKDLARLLAENNYIAEGCEDVQLMEASLTMLLEKIILGTIFYDLAAAHRVGEVEGLLNAMRAADEVIPKKTKRKSMAREFRELHK